LSHAAPMLTVATAVTGLAGVVASAMVYVDTGRRLWSRRIVFGNFFGSVLVLGAVVPAAALGGIGGPVRGLLSAAILLQAVLFLWRRGEVRAALGNRASRVHYAARVIRELLPHIQHVRLALFVVSSVFALLALINVAGRAAMWAVLTALAMLGAEVAGRYVFFAAGAGKRMPGGVAA
jgi:formate dehydrogenase iron-sulfur subunit